jgi:hypothetical protein
MNPMTSEEYYVAPSQEVFDSVKRGAIAVWSSYDDTYGYATGKINRIKDIENVRDNCAYMVAMFDSTNRFKLRELVDTETARDYVQRLIDTETAAMLAAFN